MSMQETNKCLHVEILQEQACPGADRESSLPIKESVF